MKALVMMEYSGRVRDALIACGHEAISCDILPTEVPGPHSTLHWWEFLDRYPQWDLMIAHPPCTYLAISGVRWLSHPDDTALPYEQRRPHPKYPARRSDQAKAIKVVESLWLQKQIPKVVIENPIGMIPKLSPLIMGPATQIVHPWWFGDPETKATCLWMRGVPKLEPTNIVAPTEHSVWLASPGPERWKERSRTFPGFATALAVQCGGIVV